MPVLWDFWVRICAWRVAIVPTADLASRLLVAAWRVRKHKTTHLKAQLAAVAFKRIRVAHKGLYESKVEELAETCPAICNAFNGPLVVNVKQAESDYVMVPMKLVIDSKSAFVGGPVDAPPAMMWNARQTEEPFKLVVRVKPTDCMGSMAFASAKVVTSTNTTDQAEDAAQPTNKREIEPLASKSYPSPKRQRVSSPTVTDAPDIRAHISEGTIEPSMNVIVPAQSPNSM